MQQWLRLSVSSSRKCKSFSLSLRVRCRWHFLLLRDLLMCHDVMRAFFTRNELLSSVPFDARRLYCVCCDRSQRQRHRENDKTEAERKQKKPKRKSSFPLCCAAVKFPHATHSHTHIQYAYRSNLKLNRTWLVCPSPYPRLQFVRKLSFVIYFLCFALQLTHDNTGRGHLRCPIQTRTPKWYLNFVFVIDFECYFLEGPLSSRPYFVLKIESACIVHVRRLLPSPSVHFVCTSLHCVKPIPTSVWFPISVRRRRKLLRFVAGMHRRIHLHLVFISIARALRMTFASGNMRRCFAGKTVRRRGRRKKW